MIIKEIAKLGLAIAGIGIGVIAGTSALVDTGEEMVDYYDDMC